MNKREQVADLTRKRNELTAEMRGLVDRAKRETRQLTSAESHQFDAAETDVRAFDERIAELNTQICQDDAAAEMARRYAPNNNSGGNTSMTETRSTLPGRAYEPSGLQVVSEPEVYRKYGGPSFFRDMYSARQNSDRAAIERLHRNNAIANDRARRQGEVRALSGNVVGAGGELVPPLWLESEFVALARPGRVTADLCQVEPLPSGTDQINIPKASSGTATAVQATQNTAIQQTDMATTSVSSPVITIAGGQTVSLQLIEQSPINVDGIILADLAADYASKLDGQILSGTGTAGQLSGLLGLSGTNAVTWTQATPALAGAGGLYSALANAIQQVHTNRFAPPDAIVMHPRRWMWICAQSDTANRPMVVPGAAGPMNAIGVSGEVAAQGPAGMLLGLPVYLDAMIPTNLGAGTNQDAIIVARRSDLYVWEGQLKAEAFQQTYAQNLSVFVRLYNYTAAILGRYPKATSIVSGTGLITPSF